MRGKRISSTNFIFISGITPAGAGKTLDVRFLRAGTRDHPRRCGENALCKRPLRPAAKSPPQVRGKRGTKPTMTKDQRITPAGAGKTRQAQPSCLPRRDHPRRCGENVAALISILLLVRITPAGAGKTKCKLSQRAFRKDHPRRCGENSILLKLHVAAEGSPPQVRGKLRARCRLHDINRITPAGAGKTLKQKRQYAVNEDHPRRCGENRLSQQLRYVYKGSPPQVRGKHPAKRIYQYPHRITPAGAGKTLFSRPVAPRA